MLIFNADNSSTTTLSWCSQNCTPNIGFIPQDIILNCNSTVTVPDGNDLFIEGNITGNGYTLTKAGGGALFILGTCSSDINVTNGNIYLGYNSVSGGPGSLTGNVSLAYGSWFFICRDADYVHNGSISGEGSLQITSAAGKTTTLTGNNTYSGETYIFGSTLALGVNSTIENSSQVYMGNNTKFDISTGNKKIKNLNSDEIINAEINLGSYTLTIGTEGEYDGGGAFFGKFTGLGGNILKYGTAEFSIIGNNSTANGTFNHNEGRTALFGNWAGNYIQTARGALDVARSNAAINGTLILQGGCISFSFYNTKLTVDGNVATPSGTTTIMLNEVTSSQANRVLIQAAGGLDITKFMLAPVSNYPNANLSVNSSGTQLIFNTESLGIEELRMENGEWRIYPNPTNGKLRIENGEWRIENVEIYDVSGRKVSSHHLIISMFRSCRRGFIC